MDCPHSIVKQRKPIVPKKFSFREWWKEEKAKLDKMSFRKAVKYIWQYYWLFIIGIIGAVWFLVYFISLCRNSPALLYTAPSSVPDPQ